MQLDFSLPSGAAVSAGCGEQMQGHIPERQLCHGEMSGFCTAASSDVHSVFLLPLQFLL